jgi:hypothetical protein
LADHSLPPFLLPISSDQPTAQSSAAATDRCSLLRNSLSCGWHCQSQAACGNWVKSGPRAPLFAEKILRPGMPWDEAANVGSQLVPEFQ